MTILGLAESFKTMNPAQSKRFLTAYFSKTMKDKNVKSWHSLHSSLEFMLSKFGINIFDSLETTGF